MRCAMYSTSFLYACAVFSYRLKDVNMHKHSKGANGPFTGFKLFCWVRYWLGCLRGLCARLARVIYAQHVHSLCTVALWVLCTCGQTVDKF